MYDTIFAVLMVLSLGLILGGGIGLIVVTLLGKIGRAWSEVPAKDRWIIAGIVVACACCATGIIAWYALIH